MFSFSSSIVLASLVALVASQASSTSVGPANAATTTHTVLVGTASGLTYSPDNFNASKGDVVEFIFGDKNHTVTQSSFANPCAPLVNATTGATGFDSGFVPIAAGSTTTMAWSLVITDDTKPIWAFCRQTGHCSKGMVLAINAPIAGNTFDKFLAAAEATAANITSNTTTTTTSASSGSTGTSSDPNSGSSGSDGSNGSSGSSGASSGASFTSSIPLTTVGITFFSLVGAMTMLF